MIRQLILRLHQEGLHDHVIAAIEAALLNGQSQPWMYDVLALSMQITDRPQEDIERVLLSRVDFTAADVPSMLVSAAYLKRLGADAQALHLYRQSSQLEPTWPEPYVRGLAIARELKDWDAVRWAATGVLTYAWTADHEKLHRDAENAAAEAEAALHTAGDDAGLEKLQTAMREAQIRDLHLNLTWSGDGDLDLIVDEPAGTTCSAGFPQSPGGGVHVHDGAGPKPANCYEEYVCAFGMPGTYRIRVRHVWGSIVGKRATLTISRYVGSDHETVRKVPLELTQEDRVIEVALGRGRRTELREVDDAGQPNGEPTSDEVSRLDELESRRTARRFVDARIQQAGGVRQAGGGVVAVNGAVGYQPVVSEISEGAAMGAMAIVSGDRRYVRLSMQPVFSNITDVFNFSFQNNGNTAPTAGGN